MIPVTKTFFPPIDEYYNDVQRIWDKQWLKNRGELLQELESKLEQHLKVSNITLTLMVL